MDPSAVRWDGQVGVVTIPDDGTFPGNRECPLLIYRGAIALDGASDAAAVVERVFHENGWGASWRNGVFPYHHYHSTAHEVLGVYAGAATLTLGGPSGVTLEVAGGDVLVLPAGTAHKRERAQRAFGVVGAYPPGPDWDLMRGRAGERPTADRNIAAVPLPRTDPVWGAEGPLVRWWLPT